MITSFNAKRDIPNPVIDPAFCDELAKLHELDDALYGANYRCQEARTLEERTARRDEFDAEAQELLMVYLAVLKHGQQMRETITPAHTGRVIPLRRRQPRDACGGFIKLTATPEE